MKDQVFVLRYGKLFVENIGLDPKYFSLADRGLESITFPLETLKGYGNIFLFWPIHETF